MRKLTDLFRRVTPSGISASKLSSPAPIGELAGKLSSPPSSVSAAPATPAPLSWNPNLSGAAVAVAPSILGHGAFAPYPPNKHGGPVPYAPIVPGRPIMWPPNDPLHHAIPAYLLKLPDLVAEKLKLCGIIVVYQTNNDEYQLVMTAPRYVQMHIKHNAGPELWAAAMAYMMNEAGKPIAPSIADLNMAKAAGALASSPE